VNSLVVASCICTGLTQGFVLFLAYREISDFVRGARTDTFITSQRSGCVVGNMICKFLNIDYVETVTDS
jgi:hypothetical protein